MKQLGLPSRKCQQCSASRRVTCFQNLLLLRGLSWSEATRSLLRTTDSGPPDCHQLGEGSYGSVFLCLDKFQRRCAVKIFKKNTLLDLSHGSSILQAVQERVDQTLPGFFPCILEAQPSFRPFPFLALEYLGSSLFSLLGEKGAFSVDDSHTIALQLKAAVRGWHTLQILHLGFKNKQCALVCSSAPAQVGRLRDVWVYPWSWFSCQDRLHTSFAYVCNSKLPSPRVVACFCGGPRKVFEACCWFVVVFLCSLWDCSWKSFDAPNPRQQQPKLPRHHPGVVPAVAILAENVAANGKAKSTKCTGKPKLWECAGVPFALAWPKLQAGN